MSPHFAKIDQLINTIERQADTGLSDRELRLRITWIIRARWALLAMLLVIVLMAAAQGYVISENSFVQLARGVVAIPFHITNPEAIFAVTGNRLYVEAMGALHGRLSVQIVLTGVAFLLNLLYHLLKNRVTHLRLFIVLQLCLDVLNNAGIVYNTGGGLSPFVFLFYFPILAAGILHSRQLSVWITTGSAILFGILAWIPGRNLFAPLVLFTPGPAYTTLTMMIHIFSFYMVAFLAGILVQIILRREGQLVKASAVLGDHLRQLGAIFSIAEIIRPGLTPEGVMAEVAPVLRGKLGLDRILYFRVEPAANRLALVSLTPDDPELRGLILTLDGPGIVAECARTGEPRNITDLAVLPATTNEARQHLGRNPFAVVPVVHRGAVVGVIGADRSRHVGVISDELFHILILLSRQLALILGH